MELIKNAFIVTMNPTRDVYTDGAVAVSGGKIQDIGRTSDLLKKYPDAKAVDARGKAIIPGLVAGHVHLFQSLYRGIGTDRPLAVWLDECIWPLSEELGRDECYLGGLLASAELIRGGATTFVDSHYIHKDKNCMDGLAEAVTEIGIRGSLCRTSVDAEKLTPHFRETSKQAAKEVARIVEKYHNSAGGRIRVRVEPLNEQLASPELIRGIYEIAREHGIGMSMHLAETATRAAYIRERHGCSPLEYLSELGVLGPHLLLAHCVWIGHRDIELLRATDTRVAYNSVSNQYLADGVAPIPEMLERGVCVSIGPDGAASNNNLSMFETMKSAILMQRANRLEMTNLNAERALEMAMLDGARAIGMESEIGSLEAGKCADLVVLDLERAEMTPTLGTISNIVYAASPQTVDSVMIDGKWVLQHGEFTTIDEKKMLRDTRGCVSDMVKRASLDEKMYRGTWRYIE